MRVILYFYNNSSPLEGSTERKKAKIDAQNSNFQLGQHSILLIDSRNRKT